MPARPTSIRLTAAQAAEVAALARDLSHTRPDLAALAPLTEGGVLRLALAHGLAVLRELADDDDRAPVAPLAGAWLDRPAAPPEPAPAAPPPEAVEVELDYEGTRYRVTCWRTAGGSIGAAWPEGHWAVEDLSPHAPPDAATLFNRGVCAGDGCLLDAIAIAAAIAKAWPRLVGAR